MLYLENNRIYTIDFQEAQKYRIPKDVKLYVIKNEATRRFLQQNGSRQRLYVKQFGRYYLPPICFNYATTAPKTITINYDYERLYPYQRTAVEKAIEHLKTKKGFFIRSGTGTGKTEQICGLVSKFGVRTVIIAPTKLIASQIKEELYQYTDKVVLAEGKDIGKRIFEFIKNDIFVCTHMTFNDHYEIINGNYDLLIIDEGHRVPQRRIEQFALWKGRYIIGLSANYKRKDIPKEHFYKIYGGYYDTEAESLPVKVLKYTYEHTYNYDDIDKAQEGYSPDSPEIRRKLLINNPERLEHLKFILKELHKKNLTRIIVFVDRKEYAYSIIENLKTTTDYEVIEMMSGDHNNVAIKDELKKKSKFIIVAMEQCVREGMNIPSLEAGVLFFSTSEENTINQLTGRVRRIHGNKSHGYFIDFVDVLDIAGTKKKILGFYERNKAYKQFGFEVLDFKDYISCGKNLFDG